MRPHHSLCIQYFAGKGYSAEFVENMTAVIEYLNSENPQVTLTETCNDILCSKCPNNKLQLCADNKKVAGFDRACLEEYGLKFGDKIEWLTLKDMAKNRIIAQGKLGEVCKNCQWKCYDI